MWHKDDGNKNATVEQDIGALREEQRPSGG
jgi:hypothetical protein